MGWLIELEIDSDFYISTFDLIPEYNPTVMNIIIDVIIPYGELNVSPFFHKLKLIFYPKMSMLFAFIMNFIV